MVAHSCSRPNILGRGALTIVAGGASRQGRRLPRERYVPNDTRTANVTGASKGMSAALANRLASDGFQQIATSLSRAAEAQAVAVDPAAVRMLFTRTKPSADRSTPWWILPGFAGANPGTSWWPPGANSEARTCEAAPSIQGVNTRGLDPRAGQGRFHARPLLPRELEGGAAVAGERAWRGDQRDGNPLGPQHFLRPEYGGHRVKQHHPCGAHPHTLATPSVALSTSSRVVKSPGAMRTVPAGKVPIVRWVAGAQ